MLRNQASIASANIQDNSIVNADINTSAAIDATKIADGSVSSTEFQYLDGVTSAIQTQITAKATAPTITANALASSFTITAVYADAAGANAANVTGLTVNATVPASGTVLLNFVGSISLPQNNTTDLFLGYRIGSGTPIITQVAYGLQTDGQSDVSFQRWLTGLTPGATAFTIAASSSQGTDPLLLATFGTARPQVCELQIVTF